MNVALGLYVGLNCICLKCSQTERLTATVEKRRDVRTVLVGVHEINEAERLLVAALCDFVTNIIQIFLLLMACSM